MEKYNDILKCLKGMKIKCIKDSFKFLTKDKIYEILDYQYVAGWHMFLIRGDNGNQGWCQEFNFEISVDKMRLDKM